MAAADRFKSPPNRRTSLEEDEDDLKDDEDEHRNNENRNVSDEDGDAEDSTKWDYNGNGDVKEDKEANHQDANPSSTISEKEIKFEH